MFPPPAPLIVVAGMAMAVPLPTVPRTVACGKMDCVAAPPTAMTHVRVCLFALMLLPAPHWGGKAVQSATGTPATNGNTELTVTVSAELVVYCTW